MYTRLFSIQSISFQSQYIFYIIQFFLNVNIRPHFFLSNYLFLNHEITHNDGDCFHYLFFHKVCFHFCGLVPVRNKCVYALSVSRIVLLTQTSSHCVNHSIVCLRFRTTDFILHDSRNVKIWRCCVWDVGWSEYHCLTKCCYGFPSLGCDLALSRQSKIPVERPISFETFPYFCQRPDVSVIVYFLPSRHRNHKNQSFIVHKTVIRIFPSGRYFEMSPPWTLRTVPFYGLSFCLHFEKIDSGFVCCNNWDKVSTSDSKRAKTREKYLSSQFCVRLWGSS
jgi:hypothetical protein